MAARGPAPDDLAPLFAALTSDTPGALDAALDSANMPFEEEPDRVQHDLRLMRGSHSEPVE
jgi:hypothetical protein